MRTKLKQILVTLIWFISPVAAADDRTAIERYKRVLDVLEEPHSNQIAGDFVRLTIEDFYGSIVTVSMRKHKDVAFLHWSRARPQPDIDGKFAFFEGGRKRISDGEEAAIEGDLLSSTFFSEQSTADEECYDIGSYWLEARIKGKHHLLIRNCNIPPHTEVDADAVKELISATISGFCVEKFQGVPFPGFPVMPPADRPFQ